MKFIKNSSSKFGKGVSLLWNGNEINNLSILHKARSLENICGIKYNSARSILFQFLNYLKIGSDDEVLVSSFTCDAVTDTLALFTDKIIPVDINNDMTMSFSDILSKISSNSKAIIIQNSFGKFGLKFDEIEWLKNKGIIVIEDCSLSYGSIENNVEHGTLGDIAIYSFEASKSITIGWGGLLKINNAKYFSEDLLNPKKLNILLDLKRYLELTACLFLTKKKYSFGPIIWYLLYSSGILTKSITNRYLLRKYPGMGIIGEKLLLNINFSINYFNINSNFQYLYNNLKDIKEIQIPIIPHNENRLVSPRFPFYVDPKDKIKLIKFMDSRKLGIGEWFNRNPSAINNNLINNCQNANNVMKKVLNIPIQSTISKIDLDKYIYAIKNFYS